MGRRIDIDLLDAICSKENLILAWRRVENSFSHGRIWFDELELAAYKFNLQENIRDLSERMRNGNYQMRPIIPAPYPKGTSVNAENDNQDGKEDLNVRQSFSVYIEDQLAWMAVLGILGPYFEEDMPAWSFGNRLYLNTWKDKNGHWINGVYRTTSENFYRKWSQGWPLYRHVLSASIKRMAFPEQKIEESKYYDTENLITIEENEAQVNSAFKVPYLEKDYFMGTNKYKLWYIALDLKKFYPHIKMSRIHQIFKERFSNQSDNFKLLIDQLTHFEIDYNDFSDEELDKMGLSRNENFEGLPTGLIVGGAIANIYMLELDQNVSERLRNERVHHILHFRYVDDHLILSDDEAILIKWIDWYCKELNKIGLEENKEKRNGSEIDSFYPTPLLTQTLHKISEIAKQPLDLLNANEFSMVYRDLQMLLVTEFPEEEIKKSTRTSFACTMLSRLISDIGVDYDKIHQLRKKWLSFLDEVEKRKKSAQIYDASIHEKLRSLIFSSEQNYPEALDVKEKEYVGDDGNIIYDSVRGAIVDSKVKINQAEKNIFNLLIYSLKETPDKPNMWLRVFDYCVFHTPEYIDNLYKILTYLKNKEQIHTLGYEYIWANLNIHLALRIVKAIYRLSSSRYSNPLVKENDENFIAKINNNLGVYQPIAARHYFMKDSMFVLQKAKQLLGLFRADVENKADAAKIFLAEENYHEMTLDSSFWILWAIDRFSYKVPSRSFALPDFIIKILCNSKQDSPYFVQLLFTSIYQAPLNSFGKLNLKRLNLSQKEYEHILLSVLGQGNYKDILKLLRLKNNRILFDEKSSRISLLFWISKVQEQRKNIDMALGSEYAATLIMKFVVKFYVDHIETLDNFSLHPADIFLYRKECLDKKTWDEWLSISKINVKCKNNNKDDLYRQLSFLSKDYSTDTVFIYGLGIIFLQLLTKEVTLPWVFNRLEYGFEWESVLSSLLAKGQISSANYNIILACLSLESRETKKLKKVLTGNPHYVSPIEEGKEINSLEDLLKYIEESLDDLKKNQISVANREVRQLVMIKVK